MPWEANSKSENSLAEKLCVYPYGKQCRPIRVLLGESDLYLHCILIHSDLMLYTY